METKNCLTHWSQDFPLQLRYRGGDRLFMLYVKDKRRNETRILLEVIDVRTLLLDLILHPMFESNSTPASSSMHTIEILL